MKIEINNLDKALLGEIASLLAGTTATIKEAVENKRKRIEEYFGKKKEETPSNPEDDVKETKETKKAKKEKKAKRGGGIEEETLELPYVLDGGCSCMSGGCDNGRCDFY